MSRDCNLGLCAHGPEAVHVAQPCAGCGRAVGMDAVTRDGAGRWVHVGCLVLPALLAPRA